MKEQRKEGDRIVLKFYVPSPQFMATVNQIKSVEGRKFNGVSKLWSVPYSPENAMKLESWGFYPEGDLKLLLHPPVRIERPEEPQATVDESLLPSTLRPYQFKAIRFLEAVGWRGMIALAPRLGKSVVSLAGYMLHEFSPVVIVTTSSGKAVWREEVKKWLGKKALTLSGTTATRIDKRAEFIIVNYDIFWFWLEELKAITPQLCIFDEVHRVSNPDLYKPKTKEELVEDMLANPATPKGKWVPVKCTEAFTELGKEAPYVVELSGTPATSKPSQLQVPLSVLNPKVFGNRYRFLHKFCDPRQGSYGWEFNGLSHEEELIPLLSQYMFRRTKEDVIKDLPKENHIYLPFEIDMAEYERELRALKEWYRGQERVSDEDLDERISKFQSLSYSKKRTQIIEWVEDFLESGEKIVLFVWYQSAAEDLLRAFKKKAVLVYGGTSPDKREKYIKQFNETDEVQVFIGNMRSCGEAISLYGASTVLYVEPPTTPALFQQTRDRIWLPSMKRDVQWYYWAVAEGTVDKARIESLQERAKLLGRLYGDKEKGNLFDDPLRKVLTEE